MTHSWNPPGIAAPVASYSHLAEAKPGHRLVFVSGQIGMLPDGTLAGPDITAQARQVYANIDALLDSLGVGAANIVKLTTLVSGTDRLPGFRVASGEWFGRAFPDGKFPAQTLCVVAGLATPELLIEIEAVIAVPA